MKFENFESLKLEAFNVANAGHKFKHSKYWFETYMKQHKTINNSSHFEKAFDIYNRYLLNEISDEQGEELIEEVEELYYGKDTEVDSLLNRMFAFANAVNKSFEKAGLSFGTVEFECPICKGQAYAQRLNTPENLSHKVTVRQGCKDCGYRMMN